jgi:peptidyl-prolyl cis-trans isomerase SurA
MLQTESNRSFLLVRCRPAVPTIRQCIQVVLSQFRPWVGRKCVSNLLLALTACVVLAPATLHARLEDRIVAVVNSDLIMWSDVKRELISEQERIRQRYHGPDLDRRLKAAEYVALTKMIERQLQLQAAKTKGIEVTDLEVNQAVEELKKQGDKRVGDGSHSTIREELLLLRVVDREVRSVVMVVEADMRRYYQEHQERFAYPEEYQLSQILIRASSPDEVGTAQGRAEAIYAALKQGENFEELALRFSEGPNAARGGRLGLVRQGEMLPAIEQALAPLPVGGITNVIESPDGFHILRVDDKKPRQFRPFEEVRAEIQALVFQQKSEDQYQTWMADLKNKAYIDIKF